MKVLKSLFVFIFIGIVAANQVLAQGTCLYFHSLPWHTSPQWVRNSQILSRAMVDVGKQGGQCKAWVQNVVLNISGNHVLLPQNRSNSLSGYPWLWKDDPTGHTISKGKVDFTKLIAGDIVQEKFHNQSGTAVGPHTYIVLRNDASDLLVIDSNRANTEKVAVTLAPISFFQKECGYTYYNVYSVR